MINNIIYLVNVLVNTNIKLEKLHNCNLLLDLFAEPMLVNNGNKNFDFTNMLITESNLIKLSEVELKIIFDGLNDIAKTYA